MNKDEAMKLALDALNKMEAYEYDSMDAAVSAIKEALAQPKTVMDYDKEELAINETEDWNDDSQRIVDKAIQDVIAELRLLIAAAQPAAQPERPQNCGSGFCSCIECVMEPAQEPVAWMHDAEGRVDVIHSEVKALWIKVGQPSGFYREKVPCKVEHYTIPLFTSPRMREHITDGTECWCTPIVESALKEKREWVGLSETEVRGEFPHSNYPWFFQTVLAIETMLKEKNT